MKFGGFGLAGVGAMKSGSSAFSGMITVPPDLGTRSSPWSKNWPKNVNIRLNGADRPKSGVVFGMKIEPVSNAASGEFEAGTPLSAAPGPEQTKPPEPHTFAAAETAAGLAAVWSTIRLLM